jgi:hypothetical protein
MIESGYDSMVIRNVDVSSEGYRSFYRSFSIYDPVCHRYEQQTFAVRGSDVYLPSSIGVESVRRFFPSQASEISGGLCPSPSQALFSMTHQPKDDLQKAAIAFLRRMEGDRTMPSRFLQLDTGKGKTYCTISLACALKVKSLIIVDTAELANQWKSQFLFHTDMKDSDVAILSGRESVDEARASRSAKAYIAIYRTVGMLMEESDNAVNALCRDLGIGLRVFDEAHVDFHAICMINAFSNVRYTVYLTATPSRSNFREDTLYGKVFGRIPYFNGKEIEDERYHTVILAGFSSLPPIDVSGSIKTLRGFNIPRWASWIASEDAYPRYEKFIFSLIDGMGLLKRGLKIAVMLPTIELIEKTKASLEGNYGSEADIGMFIGSVPKAGRRAELSHKLILTNDKIFDKGIDVEDLDVLILMVPFSSKVKTEQVMGRLRQRPGKPSVLIDVADVGFQECVSQQRSRKRVYVRKAKSVSNLIGGRASAQ